MGQNEISAIIRTILSISSICMRLPRLHLAIKIWLALFLSTTVVVIGMIAWMRYSFDRDFKGHINRVAKEQIEYLAPKLQQLYAIEGDFSRLTDNPRQWNRLERGAWLKAFGISQDNDNEDQSSQFRRNRDDKPHKRPHFKNRPIRTPTNLVLANELKEPLIGIITPDNPVLNWRPLNVDGELVGYLGFSLHHHKSSQRELKFLKKQSNNFLLFGIIALVVSGAFALPIAALLVKPIKRLQSATENLSQGNFQTRVEISGHDELAQLGQHFNHLAKTLDDNQKQRRRWVADISHELRTPVTFIKGQIESFVDGIRPTDTKNLLALEKQINQLNTLINDLYQLSLSELGALNYKKKTQLIHPIIESITLGVEAAYREKALELNTTISLPENYRLLIDSDRLEQLLLNLLTNSLRYTDAPGLVTLTCSHENDDLKIVIEDTKPGVAEQDLPQLFDTLYRSDSSRNRDYGGAGIGLAICKNIINAHHGSIGAELSKLGGLKITCLIPSKSQSHG